MSVQIDYSTKEYDAEDGNGDYYPFTYHFANVTGDDADNRIESESQLTSRYSWCDTVTIDGGAGDDTIVGTAREICVVDGGSGDDLIFVDSRQNSDFFSLVRGGEGIDTLAFKTPSNVGVSANLATGHAIAGLRVSINIFNVENLKGTDLNDDLTGDQSANQINGGAGNDWIDGGAGNDFLFGDAGNDTLIDGDGDGNDKLFGGTGDDRFIAGTGNATIDGGSGSDTYDYSQSGSLHFSVDLAKGIVTKSQDAVVVGIDTIKNIENIIDNADSQLLLGSLANNALYGNDGNDTLQGNGGSDLLDGGAGNDVLQAGAGFNTLSGGDGDDFIVQDAYRSKATIDGGAGFDTLSYLQGPQGNGYVYVNLGGGEAIKYNSESEILNRDRISNVEAAIGSRQNDNLIGSASDNLLDGNAGNDVLKGIAGDDTLIGGDGNDQLFGGAGNDLITGGAGNDVIGLDGGGDDVFIFDRSLGQDRIINLSTANASGFDVVQFNDISTNEIVFQRAGKDLQIAIADNSKAITIVNWFSIVPDATHPNALAIDQFAAGDAVLNADSVNVALTLVGAHPVSMASLLPASVV